MKTVVTMIVMYGHLCLGCPQDYFKEMTDQSIRKELYEKDKDSWEDM